MLTSDHFFLLYFFPIFIVTYMLLGKRISLGNIIIILFSTIFYASFGIENLPILILPLVVDYAIAIAIYRSKRALIKKIILGVAVILNLALLGYFKYSGFLSTNLELFVNFDFFNLLQKDIILPVGISFITFQRISYLVDTYRKEITPEFNVIRYATYASLFPHLLAGPIVRYSEVKKELSKRFLNSDSVYKASQLFVSGLAFKVLIADQLFFVEDHLTTNLITLNSGESIILIIYFSFRIYFDFLGYSLMALGLAKFAGFDFPINFNSPYQSKSITEFWRRWNMTLSRWLRDYLYIPLGGNRKGKIRLYMNLIITMLLAGLWHGASWNFVIWGAIHGAFLALERSFVLKNKKKASLVLSNHVRLFYTFSVVTLAWIAFKFSNISDITTLINNISSFRFEKFDFITGNLLTSSIPAIFAAIIWSFFFHEIKIPTDKFRYRIVILLVIVFLLSLIFSLIRRSVPFIYFQF